MKIKGIDPFKGLLEILNDIIERAKNKPK